MDNPEDRLIAAECHLSMVYIAEKLGGDAVKESRTAIDLAQTSMDARSSNYRQLMSYIVPRQWQRESNRHVIGLGRELVALHELSTPVDSVARGEALDLLTCCYHSDRNMNDARRCFVERLREFSATPSEKLVCNEWFINSCELVASRDERQQAIAKLAESIQASRSAGRSPDEIAQLMRWLARVKWQTNDKVGAMQIYSEFMAYKRQYHLERTIEWMILTDYAYCLKKEGDVPGAEKISREAQECLAGHRGDDRRPPHARL